MASYRTDTEKVKEALMDDYGPRADGTYPNLVPSIRRASLLTTRINTCATDRGYTLSTDELREIETLLAAHFYASTDQPYESSETRFSKVKYQGKTGMYLEGTKYGQNAIMLDPSGCLQAVGSSEGRNTGRMYWLGLPPSEQTDYVDRD